MEKLVQVITNYLYQKALITSSEIIADLSNTQRQTQKGRQNGETKKYAPNERTERSPVEEYNEMEATKIPDETFKNNGYPS